MYCMHRTDRTGTSRTCLTEKSKWKVKSGTGLKLYYNDDEVLIFINQTLPSIKNDVSTDLIALPNGVEPIDPVFIKVALMFSNWRPSDDDIFFTFEKGLRGVTPRIKSPEITSSRVVVDYKMFPRSFFTITD